MRLSLKQCTPNWTVLHSSWSNLAPKATASILSSSKRWSHLMVSWGMIGIDFSFLYFVFSRTRQIAQVKITSWPKLTDAFPARFKSKLCLYQLALNATLASQVDLHDFLRIVLTFKMTIFFINKINFYFWKKKVELEAYYYYFNKSLRLTGPTTGWPVNCSLILFNQTNKTRTFIFTSHKNFVYQKIPNLTVL